MSLVSGTECDYCRVFLCICIQDGEGRGMIHLCAASGTDQTLSALLAAGCQLEARDGSQRTPLHWTARRDTREGRGGARKYMREGREMGGATKY